MRTGRFIPGHHPDPPPWRSLAFVIAASAVAGAAAAIALLALW